MTEEELQQEEAGDENIQVLDEDVAEWALLNEIYERPGRTMGQYSSNMGFDVQAILERLIKKDIVRSVPKNKWALTETGRDLADAFLARAGRPAETPAADESAAGDLDGHVLDDGNEILDREVRCLSCQQVVATVVHPASHGLAGAVVEYRCPFCEADNRSNLPV